MEKGRGVRFGLTAIKNVGEGAIESLLAVRAAQGRITSLHALCEDLDLRLANKRVFESLVKAGAFDSLAERDASAAGLLLRASPGAPSLPRSMPPAIHGQPGISATRNEGQAQLFGLADAGEGRGRGAPRCVPLPAADAVD